MNTTSDTRHAKAITMLANGTARDIRERAGWSRRRVAEAVNVTERTVLRWENQSHVPERATAVKLYELLERLVNTPEALLTDEEGTER
ncbi:helix-turn-helix transcriptional regulator [Streptomyces sp. B1-3]|uniref:helix-turn-helix transcriptional regulator n=1 Tax=Streptomyces sp. B1-3 TaxID=3141453 RepID=UPI003D2CF1AD